MGHEQQLRLTKAEADRIGSAIPNYDRDDLLQECLEEVWRRGVSEPSHVRRVSRSKLNKIRLREMALMRAPHEPTTQRVWRLLSLEALGPSQASPVDFSFRVDRRKSLIGSVVAPENCELRIEARIALSELQQALPAVFDALVAAYEKGSLHNDDPQCKEVVRIARSFLEGDG